MDGIYLIERKGFGGGGENHVEKEEKQKLWGSNRESHRIKMMLMIASLIEETHCI
jgi:hypothetical protein